MRGSLTGAYIYCMALQITLPDAANRYCSAYASASCCGQAESSAVPSNLCHRSSRILPRREAQLLIAARASTKTQACNHQPSLQAEHSHLLSNA